MTVEQFGTWFVTDYGVENFDHQYHIAKSRVHEMDWELHMAGKKWVDMYDFLMAIRSARIRWAKSKRRTRTESAA